PSALAQASFAANRLAYVSAVSRRRRVHWKTIEVVNLPSGKPTLKLTEGALKRLVEITPDGHEAHIHLTMTDDDPWAEAQVIIEALPK
ncbi:MAG: holo-ACP synthase, partial [Pseudomonadota bacterium]